MTSPKITDALIESVHDAIYRFASSVPMKERIRRGLEAALAPEEEIPVSLAVRNAGLAAYYNQPVSYYEGRSEYSAHDQMAKAFRAMVKRKELEAAPSGASEYWRTGGECMGLVPNQRSGRGRRKDDQP